MKKILNWIAKLWHRLFGKGNRITIIKEETVNLPVLTVDEVIKDALQETRQKKRTYHARPMTDREKQLYYGRSYKAFENYKRHLL